MADDRKSPSLVEVPRTLVASVLALGVAAITGSAGVIYNHASSLSKIESKLARVEERIDGTVAAISYRITTLESFGPGSGGRFTKSDARDLREELRSDLASVRSELRAAAAELRRRHNRHAQKLWHDGADKRMEGIEEDMKECFSQLKEVSPHSVGIVSEVGG